MDTKEKSNHEIYCEEVAHIIEESSLDTQDVSIEQTYGEYMDPESFEHEGGSVYGDLDVFVQTSEGNLYIEVKTNPLEEDIKKGKEQMAKASYLLDQLDHTLLLKDSEIEDLNCEEISDWNLQETKFQTEKEHLTLEDAQKTKPQEYQPKKTSQEDTQFEIEVENDFTWSSNQIQTKNLPKTMPRHELVAI